MEAATAAATPAAADTPAQQPAAAAPAAAGEPSPVTAMDIRIGQIRSIEKHPDADSLYVEQVRERFFGEGGGVGVGGGRGGGG